MIEEPYRWLEAITNRREYIETQLSTGTAIVAVSCAEGILFVTHGQQKIFEIYDRIALGAIGHPGDLERLRMAAIEVASTEGFTRSAADVSLRRMAHYSLSPLLKTAFEQVYGAPYLARLLFAEVGATPADDLFVRLEYDGAISATGSRPGRPREGFAVISGNRDSTAAAEKYLREKHDPLAAMSVAFQTALGAPVFRDGGLTDTPTQENTSPRAEVEGALLERKSDYAIRYRPVTEAEIHAALRG